jgi:hypothetical protein
MDIEKWENMQNKDPIPPPPRVSLTNNSTSSE